VFGCADISLRVYRASSWRTEEKYSEAMDINASIPLVSWNLAKSMPSALQLYKVCVGER
jgi:hypothetical protein